MKTITFLNKSFSLSFTDIYINGKYCGSCQGRSSKNVEVENGEIEIMLKQLYFSSTHKVLKNENDLIIEFVRKDELCNILIVLYVITLIITVFVHNHQIAKMMGMLLFPLLFLKIAFEIANRKKIFKISIK